MLRQMIPLANSMTVSKIDIEGHDMPQLSESPDEILRILSTLGYRNAIMNQDPLAAFDEQIRHDSRPLVITGSLYFISTLYPHITKQIQDHP